MYPAPFEYVAPRSLDEAISLLRESDGDAKILAGGHSLLPLMKLRLAQPRILIDIGRIPGLDQIRRDGDALTFGPLVTYRMLERSPEVQELLPVLAETAREIGDAQVRARGTLAGSLAHADPAGDMPAVVLALGGRIRAQGPGGAREIAADEFFLGMLMTALDENEVITQVRLPLEQGRVAAVYEKFDQPASHYALAGICARVRLDEAGRLRDVRIGISGVGSIAYRPEAAEQALAGVSGDDENGIRNAVQSVADGVDVQSDIHAGTEYRAHLARVLARRAVLRAARRATGSDEPASETI